jgi:ABC-type long-subunit fatty acid transport system fused permease/ATPase subunit
VLTKVKQHNNQKNFRIFSNNEAKKIISTNNTSTQINNKKYIIQINQKAKIKQPTTVHQRVFTSVKFFVCPNCRYMYMYTSRTLFSGHTNLFLLFLSSPPRKKEHTTLGTCVQVPSTCARYMYSKKTALSFLCYKRTTVTNTTLGTLCPFLHKTLHVKCRSSCSLSRIKQI